MISKLARCFGVARLRRGYQSSGVAILRPSISVTTSSVAVNSTERGRRSPTSISKVLIPGRHQLVAMRFQKRGAFLPPQRREVDRPRVERPHQLQRLADALRAPSPVPCVEGELVLDVRAGERLVRAAAQVGLALLDHAAVGEGGADVAGE